MSIFTTIKENVTAKDVAEHYDLRKSGNLYLCPFHNDGNPSLLAKERFYCFGCGEKGDAVDLTAGIFNIGPKEAAEMLAADFGLFIPEGSEAYNPGDKPDKKIPLREECLETVIRLNEHRKELKSIIKMLAPLPGDEKMTPAFVLIQRKLDVINDLLYHFSFNLNDEEKRRLIDKSNELMKGDFNA